MFGDSLRRGYILPLAGLGPSLNFIRIQNPCVIVEVVAGLVVAETGADATILDDAGTNAGGEGEVDGEATETVGFVEGGEVGVVF